MNGEVSFKGQFFDAIAELPERKTELLGCPGDDELMSSQGLKNFFCRGFPGDGRQGLLVKLVFYELTDEVFRDHFFPGHDEEAFQEVFQLSYVSGKGITHKELEGLGGKQEFSIVDFLHFGQEETGESGDVLFSFPQWWKPDREDIQTIVEIFPKAAFLDQSFQVLIGSGHEPYFYPDGFVTSQSFKLPFLDKTQEFALERGAELAYFVQKDRATVGHFQATGFGARGSSESPFFVAEQFGLQEILWQGSAVYLDKGLIPARTQLVYEAGRKGLTSARFSQEQDRGPGRGHLLYQGENFFHPGALGGVHEFAEAPTQFVFQQEVFFSQSGFASLHLLFEFDELSDERRHNFQEPDVFLKGYVSSKESIHPQDSQAFLAQLDGNGDESDDLLGEAPRAGTVQEKRLLAHVGDQTGLSRGEDTPGHPFFWGIDPLGFFFWSQAVGGPDAKGALGLVKEHHRSPLHVKLFRQNSQDAAEGVFEIEGLADEFVRGVKDLEFECVKIFHFCAYLTDKSVNLSRIPSISAFSRGRPSKRAFFLTSSQISLSLSGG